MQVYAPLLSQLRLVLISKMAKPEEVLVVVDENGEVVRESVRDTDEIILYKSMRDCLVYLTNLDPQDTQQQMLGKLALQVYPPIDVLCVLLACAVADVLYLSLHLSHSLFLSLQACHLISHTHLPSVSLSYSDRWH
jgi:hypothetical protein